MKQFDVLIKTKNGLEWVTEIFQDSADKAIHSAIDLLGKGKYIEHKEFNVVNGAWVEVA